MTNPDTYTVQAGDTLSIIARKFSTTVQELGRINHIKDVNRISVGQVLKLTNNQIQVAEDATYVSLFIFDGHDLPIAGLDVSVNLPTGQKIKATTTETGAISVPIPPDANGHAKVDVTDYSGKQQTVCTLELSKCQHSVAIRSPKIKVDVTPRSHKQKPPAPSKDAPTKTNAASAEHWWNNTGAFTKAWDRLKDQVSFQSAHAEGLPATKTLNSNGHPVTVAAGPECPNADNLVLGQNNIYRQAILDASKRLGLIPQALCALLDCEASKIVITEIVKDAQNKPVLDKKGKPVKRTLGRRWNADSYNAASGAAGMTQFLASTWLGFVLRPGNYIHEQSVALNWVRQEAGMWQFLLSDHRLTTKPWHHKDDANVKACLEKRKDPTWSIHAAADYGAANLLVLKSAKFNLHGLNDMDKAKLMYLMHHEGEGNGPAFVSDTLNETKLLKVFKLQTKDAESLVDAADGKVAKAYRKWFARFVNDQFQNSHQYFCSNQIGSRDLSDLLIEIGGKGIKK